jgi:hypothetical protein
MKTTPHRWIEVSEPIDYERLYQSYVRNKWCWTDGISPEKIMETVEQFKAYSGTTRYISSGGIVVDCGKILIHHRLFTFYVLPPQNALPASLPLEQGDWAAKLGE